MVVVVIIATYAGNLTATLTTNKALWPFKTLQEYADHPGYPLYLEEGSFTYSFLSVIIM